MGEDKKGGGKAMTAKFALAQLEFDVVDMKGAVGQVLSLAHENRVSWVVTPNSDHVVRSLQDKKFLKIAQQADLLIADGMPIVWGSKLLGHPLPERVTGADLLPAVCKEAAENNIKVCFLGGLEGDAEKAVKNFKMQFPDFNGIWIYPPFGFEKNELESRIIINRLKKEKPGIIFVGVGSPKQEYWIFDNRKKLSPGVYLGIGMSISLAAGTKRRAPLWLQSIGMEWVYRIYQEPRRMLKRYLGNLTIFGVIFKAWMKGKIDR